MKELKLSNTSVVACVDEEDFERLSAFNWCLSGHPGRFSIQRTNTYNKHISLASEIMHQRKVMFDHRDRNPFNNTKANLRECSYSQNGMNRKKKSGCSSVYKGVSWCSATSKWRAHIKINGNLISLGCFREEKEAAKAYNNKALELFKEFANLNEV